MHLHTDLAESIRTCADCEKVLEDFERLYKGSVFPPYEKYQRELLTAAIQGENLELLTVALERGYLSSFDYDYTAASPLLVACKDNRIDVVRLLLKYGANVDQRSIYAWPNVDEISALEIAMERDNLELLQVMLPFSAHRKTLLHKTSNMGGVKCLEYLLKQPDIAQYINYPDYAGETPLTFGVQQGAHITQLLVENGSDVLVRDKRWKQTCIHKACSNIRVDLPEILQILLSNGADPDVKCCKGQTGLDILLEKALWPCTEDELQGTVYASRLQHITLHTYHSVIYESAFLLLKYGLTVDTRERPKQCKHFVNIILDTLHTLSKDSFSIAEKEKVVSSAFECLSIILSDMVDFGADLRDVVQDDWCSSTYDRLVNSITASGKNHLKLFANSHLLKVVLAHGLTDDEKSGLIKSIKDPIVLAVLNTLTQEGYNKHIRELYVECSGYDDGYLEVVRQESGTCRSLQQLCRMNVQSALHTKLIHNIEKTTLPKEVQMYVLTFD